MYWNVKVRDATKEVLVNGTLLDAMRGTPGTTIGCHLSNSACNRRNRAAWEEAHAPPRIMSFSASRAIAILEWTKGTLRGRPYDAIGVEYAHNLGYYTDLNDKCPSKTYLAEHPEIADLEIRLRPPRRRTSEDDKREGRSPPTGRSTGERRSGAPKGALLRAQKAGLIPASVVRQLNETHSA
jgi:hypothetical protein